jgi:hypothetical protein
LFYRYSNDNENWGPWTFWDVDELAPYEWIFTPPNSYGYYEFYTVATDVALNVENAPDEADVAVCVVIPAEVDICPKSLNLRSRGRWITAFIELPLGYDVREIDVGTAAVEGGELMEAAVPAEPRPTAICDHDNDGIPDLMVKFDRSDVQELVEVGENVELAVIGRWRGIWFRGSDNIRAIDFGEEQDQGNEVQPEVQPGHSGKSLGQGQGNRVGPQGAQGQGAPQTLPRQCSQHSEEGQGGQGNHGQWSPEMPPGQNDQSPGRGNQQSSSDETQAGSGANDQGDTQSQNPSTTPLGQGDQSSNPGEQEVNSSITPTSGGVGNQSSGRGQEPPSTPPGKSSQPPTQGGQRNQGGQRGSQSQGRDQGDSGGNQGNGRDNTGGNQEDGKKK